MGVPVVREGSQAVHRAPHPPRKPKGRGIAGKLIASLFVLVVLSTAVFAAVRLLGEEPTLPPQAAAADHNTGLPANAEPSNADQGSGQAPGGSLSEKKDDPVVVTEGPSTTPISNETTSKDAGPDHWSSPSTDTETEQANLITVVGITTLVNRTHPLSPTYVPELVQVNARMAYGITADEKLMRPEAAQALEIMLQQAEQEGVILYCVSGYRSYATQKWLYEYRVQTEGQTMADLYTARPGQSEHQTGLAMDLANAPNGALLDEFGETMEGQWLAKNAHKFGFIIRYPLGREETTGYNYEPWHLRYVGVEAATEIYTRGIVLEEYVVSP